MSDQTDLDLLAKALRMDGFSDEPGQRAVDFMSNLPAVHGEKAKNDEPIGLYEWEESAVRKVFGTIRDDGLRQYETVYEIIAKKNGKSSFAGMVVLYMLLMEAEPAAEHYSVAYTRDQASHVWRVVEAMCETLLEREPEIEDLIWLRGYYKELHNKMSGGFYKPIAGEERGSHGYNPYLTIFDELHVQKKRDLYDSMEAGVVRPNALFWSLTTAGYDRTSVCYEIHDYAVNVDRKDIEDPGFLPIIYAADNDDDWTDPKVWKKANPALDEEGGITRAKLMRDCARAKRIPARQNKFKRLHLNIWTDQQTAWIPREEWDPCAEEFEFADLIGRECFGGIDLAVNEDLAAHVLVFPDGNDHYTLWPIFWMSREQIEEKTREHGIPYRTWVEQGHLIETPGNTNDFSAIADHVLELSEKVKYQEIGYDGWNAEHLAQILAAEKLKMIRIRQGMASMSEPSKKFEALVLNRQISHPDHPVMNWCISNVEVWPDKNDNIRPVRPDDRRKKIDGVVAAVMALGRAIVRTEKKSMYSDPDFEPVYVELGA